MMYEEFEEEPASHWHRTRVVVVGSERPGCRHIALWLARRGCVVRLATTLAEAVAGEIADAELVIVDSELAGGTGIAALRELRKHGITAPALLLTPRPTGELFAHAAELDAALVVAP